MQRRFAVLGPAALVGQQIAVAERECLIEEPGWLIEREASVQAVLEDAVCLHRHPANQQLQALACSAKVVQLVAAETSSEQVFASTAGQQVTSSALAMVTTPSRQAV